MKVKDLEINQQIIINSFVYAYEGVKKVNDLGYLENKIVFKGVSIQGNKHFDLPVGNKDLKEINGNLELK